MGKLVTKKQTIQLNISLFSFEFPRRSMMGADRTGLEELILEIHLPQIFSLQSQPCKTHDVLTIILFFKF